MTTTKDRHVPACRCIWCASDPNKTRETPSDCGTPHPYAGQPCTRPAGHAGGHGNEDRAWLAETPSEPHSASNDGSGADQAGFYPSGGPRPSAPEGVLSLSPSRENPDPFDTPPGPVSVWQCPGCGFVIGIDECCDCR